MTREYTLEVVHFLAYARRNPQPTSRGPFSELYEILSTCTAVPYARTSVTPCMISVAS